jgi:hypothetical protein
MNFFTFVKSILLIIFWIPYWVVEESNSEKFRIPGKLGMFGESLLLAFSLVLPLATIFYGYYYFDEYYFKIAMLLYLVFGLIFFRMVYPILDKEKTNQKTNDLFKTGITWIQKALSALIFGCLWIIFLYREVVADDVGNIYQSQAMIFFSLGITSLFILTALVLIMELGILNSILMGALIYLMIGLTAITGLQLEWGNDFMPEV